MYDEQERSSNRLAIVNALSRGVIQRFLSMELCACVVVSSKQILQAVGS